MLTLLLGVSLASQGVPSPTIPAPAKEVHGLVQAFQEALKKQDRERFRSLFLKEGVVWQKVHSEGAVLGAKGQGKTLPRVPDQGAETPFLWFDRMVAKGRPFEERFHDLKVVSDGSVASATFRFEFLVSGNVTNDGLEAWHLVKTDQGWKIASVVFSVNRP